MRPLSLIALLLTLSLSTPSMGQSTPAPFAALEFHSFASAPVPLYRGPALADGKDYTLTGFLIGAGLGLAAGWLMYDAFCEAVNNQCSDSPVRLVGFGGAIGGALGALVGSIAE